MEHYYRRELEALADAGFSVDRSFFAEMVHAEKGLGPPVPIVTEVSEHEVAPGIVISTSMSSGSRRDGFETLRDIVTRHRRRWEGAYLDGYLRSRWEPQLRTVAWEHSRWLAAKGKGPTLKQFAKLATPAANAWFGGNLGDLFGAVGEKPRVKPQRVALMPPNRVRSRPLCSSPSAGSRWRARTPGETARSTTDKPPSAGLRMRRRAMSSSRRRRVALRTTRRCEPIPGGGRTGSRSFGRATARSSSSLDAQRWTCPARCR
jgi:hypothetical protein